MPPNCCRSTAEGYNTREIQPRITKEELALILACGVLFGEDSHSFNLLMFKVFGYECALRGESEHKDLLITDFTLKKDEDGIEVLKWNPRVGRKTHSGGFYVKDIPEEISLYANRKNPLMCPIRVFKQALARRPEGAPPNFYLACCFTGSRDKGTFKYTPDFKKQALGINEIKKMMKEICDKAGITQRANHALRRTCICDMYDANMPEYLIMKRSRHRSLEGLRKYNQ